jgi:hypothetical protein
MTCGGPDITCQSESVFLNRGGETETTNGSSISKERVERLVGKTEPTRLAAEIGKLHPHLGVLTRGDDESANLEDSLPDVDVSLAARKSARAKTGSAPSI